MKKKVFFAVYFAITLALLAAVNYFAYQSGVSVNECIMLTAICLLAIGAKGYACYMILS